jgi:hypothetical protein
MIDNEKYLQSAGRENYAPKASILPINDRTVRQTYEKVGSMLLEKYCRSKTGTKPRQVCQNKTPRQTRKRRLSP